MKSFILLFECLYILANFKIHCTNSDCPSRCICSHDSTVIDCRYKGLRDFPDNIPSHAQILLLDHNNISQIPADLNLRDLTVFSLSKNHISILQRNMFAKLYRLKILTLSSNMIYTITGDEWTDNHHVSEINLSDNYLSEITLNFTVFMPHLKILNLTRNKINRLFYGNERGSIRRGRFYLDLSYNKLHRSQLPELMAILGPSIDGVDLSFNKQLKYPHTLKSIVRALRSTKIRRLKLGGLKLTYLAQFLFHDAFLPQLIHLDMSENYLSHIEEHSLSQLDKIETLNLEYNYLSENPNLRENYKIEDLNLSHNRIHIIYANRLPRQLKRIDLGHNCLTVLHGEAFQNLSHLTSLILSANSINRIVISDNDLRNLNELDISNNLLLNHNVKDILNKLHNLISLDISRNKIDSIWINMTVQLSNLEYLNLSSNLISQTFSVDIGANNLKVLDLSFNKIHILFDYYTKNLKRLFLNNNQISNVDKNAFSVSRLIEVLDISDNPMRARIVNLWRHRFYQISATLRVLRMKSFEIYPYLRKNRWDFYQPFTSLEELNIWNCSIMQAPNKDDLLPQTLRHIDIGHNYLSQIDSQSFGNLPNLQEIHMASSNIHHVDPLFLSAMNQLKRLNMVANPIICDCSHLPSLLLWAYTTNVTVDGLYFRPYLRCSHPNKYINKPITNFQSAPCFISTDNTPIYAGVSAGLLLIVCVAVPYLLAHLVFIRRNKNVVTRNWIELGRTHSEPLITESAGSTVNSNCRSSKCFMLTKFRSDNASNPTRELLLNEI